MAEKKKENWNRVSEMDRLISSRITFQVHEPRVPESLERPTISRWFHEFRRNPIADFLGIIYVGERWRPRRDETDRRHGIAESQGREISNVARETNGRRRIPGIP